LLTGLCARRAHAQAIAAAFRQRSDLQPAICTALQRLCLQTRAALLARAQAPPALPALRPCGVLVSV